VLTRRQQRFCRTAALIKLTSKHTATDATSLFEISRVLVESSLWNVSIKSTTWKTVEARWTTLGPCHVKYSPAGARYKARQNADRPRAYEGAWRWGDRGHGLLLRRGPDRGHSSRLSIVRRAVQYQTVLTFLQFGSAGREAFDSSSSLDTLLCESSAYGDTLDGQLYRHNCRHQHSSLQLPSEGILRRSSHFHSHCHYRGWRVRHGDRGHDGNCRPHHRCR
jgi:hypothetical protein